MEPLTNPGQDGEGESPPHLTVRDELAIAIAFFEGDRAGVELLLRPFQGDGNEADRMDRVMRRFVVAAIHAGYDPDTIHAHLICDARALRT